MAEVYQVTRSYLPYLWSDCARLVRREPLGQDLNALHSRLLSGQETAWVALTPKDRRPIALILTHVAERKLTIHFAGGRRIEEWIASARERLSEYARLCNCHELRIMARKGWKEYVISLGGSGIAKVSFSRDRPTSKGRGRQNKVGYYRGVPACPPSTPTAATTS